MNEFRSLEDAYQAAFDGVLTVIHEPPGLLFVEGADRLDLLHRMSTNALENLETGQVRPTVFTDPVGRTIDVVTVIALEATALLVASSGRAEIVRDWLQRHIFFRDDVQLRAAEPDWILRGDYGPRAGENLGDLVPEVGWSTETGHGYVWAVNSPVGGFLSLLSPAVDNTDNLPMDQTLAAYEILRVEAGLPKVGAEIMDDTIPLEAGLWDAVNFEKGCYVGQEIIARLESRGRLAKTLVGLEFEGEATPGATLMEDGRKIGSVTSVAHSPRNGWVGLGLAKPSAIGAVALAGNDGPKAVIVELPGRTGVPTTRTPLEAL